MNESHRSRTVLTDAQSISDPALIVLPGTPSALPPESENDRRHRALANAGYRSHAETLLLAGADDLRSRSFANTLLSDREAERLFDREAGQVRSRAIEAARRRFGAADRETEAVTNESLLAIGERLKRGGLERRRQQLVAASIETLSEEAADLTRQVERDPDRYPHYRPLLDRALARFDAVEPEQRAALAEQFAQDLDTAHIAGLAGQGRMDEAHRELDAASERLGRARTAELERMLGASARTQIHDLAAGQALFAADLAVRLASGDIAPDELDETERRGEISPAQAARLRRMQSEREERERQVDGLIELAANAVGEGAPLDPADARDRTAAELYWTRVLMPAYQRRGAASGPRLVALVTELGIVPEALRQAIGLGLTEENAETVAGAARLVAGLVAANESFMERFSNSELAFVNLVSQALYGGADAKRAVAFAHGRMTFPEPVRPTDEPREDRTGTIAGLVQNEAAGAAAKLLAERIQPTGPVGFGTPLMKPAAGNIDGYFAALWSASPWGTKSAVEATMSRRLQHPVLGPLSLDPEAVRKQMQNDAVRSITGRDAELQGSP